MVLRCSLTVNGTRRAVAAPPETPLLDVLRNDLGLMGVRTGCRMGECGACTVLLGERPERSCQVAIAGVGTAEVVTLEGLGSPDDPHPVQQAFLDEQAGQCGYCINGIIMEAVAALRSDPTGSREAVLEALRESICRCGTHVRILRAIRRAAGRPDEEDRRPAEVLRPAWPCGPASACDADAPALPPTVAAAPTVASWLRLAPDGRIVVLTGKVELGQGIRTALAQIVAAQLGVPLQHVVVRSTATGEAPDERYTSGSQSVEESGTALAMAARAARRLLLERAAELFDVRVGALAWDVAVPSIRTHDGREVTLAELRSEGPVGGPIESVDRPDWTAVPLGAPVHRDDLRTKLSGAAAYVHDMAPDGLLHARALLPPTQHARAADIPVAAAASMPGVRATVGDGRLVVVVAEREEQAVRAVARIRDATRWEITGRHDADPVDAFRSRPAVERTVRADEGVAEALAAGHAARATYTRPYQAHGSMAPSCAVAVAGDDRLIVWTHSQGVYPLRRELAALLGVGQDRVRVIHRDGPGCYGHNLADDAAAFAALAAGAVPGTPVRFQFTVQDEFAWEPFGSAMLSDLGAALDDSGAITAWHGRITTDVHGTRPTGAGDRLMPAWLRADEVAPPEPEPGSGGRRNAVPIYAIPSVDITTRHVSGPLRVSALRSLGAFHNVFANESFIDELAELAGSDPLEFRLRHLDDGRARAVLETTADRAGWEPHVGPSGRGVGLALARYKDAQAWVGMAVGLDVDTDTAAVTVHRIVMACDAGTVVNPDGLANQLEGGALQGLSRTLHEAVRYDGEGIRTIDWTTYPVLRFAEVPDVQVTLLDRPGLPPLGAGEASTPLVGAAVANAIDDAVGVRMRDLPITPDRIRERLLGMTDDELARVLV